MRYKAEFTGRTKDSIGIRYPIVTYVEGEDKEAASLKLYDKYDHVNKLMLTKRSEISLNQPPFCPLQAITLRVSMAKGSVQHSCRSGTK